VLTDTDDRVVLLNRRFGEIFGADAAANAVGRKYATLMRAAAAEMMPHGLDTDAWVAEQDRRRREAVGPYELALANGRWVRVGDRRTASGAIVGIRTDITELKQRERELKRSRRLLQGVVDAVPAIINVKDRQSRYVMVNRFQGELWGVAPQDAVGRTSADFTGAGYGGRSREMDEEVIRSGQALPWAEPG